MLLATGTTGAPDISIDGQDMQGLACGQMGGADYCFPSDAVNGWKTFSGSLWVHIPIPSHQQEDCFRVTDDGRRELSVMEATPNDTMDQQAQRVLAHVQETLAAPLVPISWNGLDCFKSGYKTGWSCVINGAALSEGMTLIECNGSEDVPVPHCSQRYYTRHLEVRVTYVVRCGVYWREMNRQIDTVLSHATSIAKSRFSR